MAHVYLIDASSTIINLCAYFHLLVAYSFHSHRLHHHYLASFHNWTSNIKCLLCHPYLACVPTFTYSLHVRLIHLLGASSLPSCLVLPPYMFGKRWKIRNTCNLHFVKVFLFFFLFHFLVCFIFLYVLVFIFILLFLVNFLVLVALQGLFSFGHGFRFP
jgi:hypothetical protein